MFKKNTTVQKCTLRYKTNKFTVLLFVSVIAFVVVYILSYYYALILLYKSCNNRVVIFILMLDISMIYAFIFIRKKHINNKIKNF